MTRHEQRYKAMTILYQAFLYDNNNISYNTQDIIDEQMTEKSKFVSSLVMGVLKEKDKLDELANKYLQNWDISRLGFTDQAILRIGIYEILNSDEKVCKMINGVLDKIYHKEVENK